jgi:hypothetical protein
MCTRAMESVSGQRDREFHIPNASGMRDAGKEFHSEGPFGQRGLTRVQYTHMVD